jgi:hypothetical protein
VTATDVSLGEVRAVTPVEQRAIISHNCQCTVCSDISVLLDTSALYLSSQDHRIISDLCRIFVIQPVLVWEYCSILSTHK